MTSLNWSRLASKRNIGPEAGDDGDLIGAEGGVDDLEVAADAEPGGDGGSVFDQAIGAE